MARAKTKKTKKTAAKPKAAAAKRSGETKKTGKKKAPAKKAAAKKATTAARKAAGAPKKAAAKKTAAAPKKAAPKKTTAAPKNAAPKKVVAAKKAAAPKKAADVAKADAQLFTPFTIGERADALRILTEDARLANMAKVGRYRVISCEASPVKPPHKRAGRRLATVLVYDYSQDRCVDAHIDLDRSEVAHLRFSKAQPMLAREEEAAAISVALSDATVKDRLSLGDQPQVAMHYWSTKDTDVVHGRRAAAVIFGQPGADASVVAVVDLVSNTVAEVVPAEQW